MKGKNVVLKVVIILILLFFVVNAIAYAMGKNNVYTMVYNYFNPSEDEKLNEIYVEGEKEDVDYVGVESSIGYKIQYDEESFNLTREDNKDYYKVKYEDISGKVYFVIEYQDTNFEDISSTDMQEININGNRAYFTYSASGSSWDSDVESIWYIEAPKGVYKIEEHYFMEAAEGWGARISQIINTFEIVEVKE